MRTIGGPVDDVVMSQTAALEPTSAMTLEASCRRHVLEPTYGACSTCGGAYCDQCLVELPAHGVTCTGCALEHAGVRRPSRSRRGFFRR